MKKLLLRLFNSRVVNMVLALLLVLAVAQPSVTFNNSVVITLGPPEAYAAGTADYALDGLADDVEVQAALSALPNQGGLLHFKAGTYNLTANVTRAIGNVTIEGEGRNTLIAGSGSFVAGGNQWVFRDLALNATTQVDMGATTGWEWANVYDQATLWNSRVQSGQVVFVTANGTTLFVTSLNGTTINATQLTATTGNISALNAPTGRGATYVIAASDAPAIWKSQADVIVSGNATDEIQTGLNTLHSNGGGTLQLSVGNFSLQSSSRLNLPSNVYVKGVLGSTIFHEVSGTSNYTIGSQGYEFLTLDNDAGNWTITSGTGTLSTESTVFQTGIGSLKFVGSTTAEISRNITGSVHYSNPLDWQNYEYVAFWMRYTSSTHDLKFRAWTGANYSEWTFRGISPNEYVEIILPIRHPDTTNGTISLGNITSISFANLPGQTFYFDEIRYLVGNVGIDGITFMADVPGDVDGIYAAYTIYAKYSNNKFIGLGDEAFEVSGSRYVDVLGNNIRGISTILGGGGGPAIAFAQAQFTNEGRNRFCHILDNSIDRAYGTSISICGDGNTVAFNSISGASISNSGIEIRHTYSRDNIILSNTIDNVRDGIYITEGANQNIVEANTIKNGNFGAGVHIISGVGNQVRGNVITSTSTAVQVEADGNSTVIEGNFFKSQTVGVKLVTLTSFNVTIVQNQFVSVVTPISDNSTNVKIFGNVGYVTSNSGNFTITAGQWGAVISHGLATNATAVQLTLTSNTTTTVYVSFGSITSTQFTANLSALQGSDITGTWRAVIGAGN